MIKSTLTGNNFLKAVQNQFSCYQDTRVASWTHCISDSLPYSLVSASNYTNRISRCDIVGQSRYLCIDLKWKTKLCDSYFFSSVLFFVLPVLSLEARLCQALYRHTTLPTQSLAHAFDIEKNLAWKMLLLSVLSIFISTLGQLHD